MMKLGEKHKFKGKKKQQKKITIAINIVLWDGA